MYYPSSDSIYAYSYFIFKGVNKLNTTVSNPGSDGTPLSIESWTGSYYDKVGGQIFLYQKTTSSFVTFPWISGTYNSVESYDSSSAMFSQKSHDTLYMEFFSSQKVFRGTAFSHPNSGRPAINGEFVVRESIGSSGGFYHYIFKFSSLSDYFSINFLFESSKVSVVPVMMKFLSQLTNDERNRVGLPTQESSQISNLTTQSKEQFEKQIAQSQKEHDEKMDTSKVSEVGGIADSLQKVGNEKTKSLLYPIQWAVNTANNLASAPATGIISLPGIFGAESFQIDLSVFERELPSVWFFLQNFIRFVISFGIIKGIFSLFKGVDE